jgi:hypothetical protein
MFKMAAARVKALGDVALRRFQAQANIKKL